MHQTPRITDTEWALMRVVWARHPVTANEIIARLAEDGETWHPKTTRTLLARLVRRKALGYAPVGRAYAYIPLVDEAECRAAASESFLARVFGGSLRPMLAQFVERQRLTTAELAELRAVLDQKPADRSRPARRKARP